MDAKINGTPVRVIVDTGFGAPFGLFSSTARKMHLKVTQPPADTLIPPGQVRAGWTKPQTVSIGASSVESAFWVVELPSRVPAPGDGVIMGWPALQGNLLSIDCLAGAITAFTNAVEKFDGWNSYWLHTNSDHLVLELPGENQLTPLVALDTGSPEGVALNPEKWRVWKAGHTNQVVTMDSYYTPNPGIVVSEEGWADKIQLGNLALTDVPVMQANSSGVALDTSSNTEYVATLGLAALKRLDIVLDGRQGAIWLRPKKTPPTPYKHNRLGAAFAPKDLHGDELIAYVANGSPAFEAGIRNGDVLWKASKRNATHWWNSNSEADANDTYEDLPVGTKIDFTLKRNGKLFKTTATLRNILPPDAVAIPN